MADSFDEQHFLDLYDRLYPDHYLGPLKDPGPGYELYEAEAEVGARVSLAISRLEDDGYFLTAGTAAFASVMLLLSRENAGHGAVTVLAGTVVTTSKGDRRFELVADTFFDVGVLGPLEVQARAVAPGWEYNVRGARTTAALETLPGEIDTILTLLEDPPFGDPTITVAQVADADGGRPASLEQLGKDRGVNPRPGESITTYRQRIRTLPDTVSPGAIKRAITSVFGPLGVTATFIETWQDSFMTYYDAPDPQVGDVDPTLFVLDDPAVSPPFRNRMLDENTHGGAFVVVVPQLPSIEEYGFLLDDPGMDPSDFTTPLGMRTPSAYDLPDADALAPELVAALDADDVGINAVYGGLYDLLQSIKAGGVTVILELEGT